MRIAAASGKESRGVSLRSLKSRNLGGSSCFPNQVVQSLSRMPAELTPAVRNLGARIPRPGALKMGALGDALRLAWKEVWLMVPMRASRV